MCNRNKEKVGDSILVNIKISTDLNTEEFEQTNSITTCKSVKKACYGRLKLH